MNKKQKAAAIAVASVMACGIFAGCDLITTGTRENLAQIVADVNITRSVNFDKEFGEGAAQKYQSVIPTSEISKRDMIVAYVSSGYSSYVSYGYSYKDIFSAISQSLYQREIYLQYAKVYFLNKGTDKDGEVQYTLDGYQEATKNKSGTELGIAACGYFLTQEEKDKADYATRVMFNNSIDSLEKSVIKEDEDDVEYESDVRTTPTGVDTSNSDFYDTAYRIYTATGAQAETKGSYEKVDGSTPSTRKKAYSNFLANLKTNDLVSNGENTADAETLAYFQTEKESDYEDALITKLTEEFTADAEEKLTEEYCTNYYNTLLNNQRSNYAKDVSAFETAMDSVSDSSFLLASPTETDKNYGYVINILLPFSTSQSNALSQADQDFGDAKGNKFVTRAALLKQIKATDQRGSWFTGETDYSFDASEDASRYTGGNSDRTWLFFKDNFPEETEKYERLDKYYGKYTYNGTYNADKRQYEPNKITVDGFLSEMTGYLASAGYSTGSLTVDGQPVTYKTGDEYYAQASYYGDDGAVDYSKFVYAAGKVNFGKSFDANDMFVTGTPENDVMSVINELSFAYNTDTAGLNGYLGYAVTANKTSFVSEFEYAAQLAVKGGAGSYVVAPSDYGWHIIYCTFSFADDENGIPFTFDYGKIKDEDTFSYHFYEAIKADTASSDASQRRTKVISYFLDSYNLYESRYSDLSNMSS